MVQSNTVPSVQVQPLTIQPVLSPYNAGPRDVLDAETLRRELATLKDLFVEAQGADRMRARSSERVAQPGVDPIGTPSQVELAQLLEALERLQTQVSRFQPNAPGEYSPLRNSTLPVPARNPGPDSGGADTFSQVQDQSGARIAYLVQQLGFDTQTARAILLAIQKDGAISPQVGAIPGAGSVTEVAAPQSNIMYENAMVDQILAELEAEMAAAGTMALDGATLPGQASADEYQLLSRYFVSAALPALLSHTGVGQVTQP